ncbi:MAG: carboxypeptidase regulatory-like domain-containing protein [Candidatus Roizmanbacteria bacterium]|nr:MAG: carboxypeptidase regulatory-like domain-containing protein [Candidatus Roizmanbacteria bacterium]
MSKKFLGIVLLLFLAFLFISPLFSKINAATIQGKVVKPVGLGSSAVSGAEIMLRQNVWSSSWATAWTTSASDGTFSLSNITVGSTAAAYVLEMRTPWNNPDGLVAPDSIAITFTNNDQTYYRDGSGGVGATNFDGSSKAVIAFTAANNTITGTLTKSNGNPISGAYVEAYKEMGNGWVQATTNASGQYTLKVGAGTWMVTPRANYGSSPENVDWTYNKTSTRVKFANNDSPGTSTTVNFTAQTANCAITGTVKAPDGSALSNPQSSVYVSVWSYNGGGNGANVDSNGAFNLKVPEGSYSLTVSSWQGNYGSPAETKFTVKDANSDGTCDGYAAGNIRLISKNSTISGRVLDSNGAAVANKNVNTWKQNGGGWGNAETDSSGNYSILVSAGTWMVSVSQDPGMSGSYSGTTYINNQAPLQVTVADGATSSSNNITLQIANATIDGRVVNSSGSTLTSLEMGYVYVETGESSSGPGPMTYSAMGAPVKNGTFTLKVPAGTYNIGVSLPSGAGYCTGSATSVTATANSTISANVALTQATGTINGYLKKDSDTGSTITGVRAEVFANSGAMNYAMATVSTTDGSYSMQVCPGDWYMGYWIDPSLTDGENNSYLRQPPSNNKITISGSQTATKNVIVKQNDATISGTVKDPDGTGFAGVWVMVDTRSNDTAGSFSRGSMFSQGAMTSSDGTYSIKVPSGNTYYVEAYVPPSYSYINPSRVSVTPTSGGTSTVNLQFGNADATITGTVTQDSTPRSAFISGWSETGGYSGTTADSNGNYSLSVSTGTNWHIKAMYDVSKTSFVRSAESVVTPTSGSNTLNLSLSTSGAMPESTTVTYTASNQKTITLSDGTTINIPAGALASSGTVTVTVTGKAQLPNQSLATPINIGYDITALDSNGSEITSNFNSNVTIVMPYTEATLTALGITENDLLAGYWDTTTNSWKSSDNVSVDTDNNTITITTNHFTDFAPFSAGKTSSSTTSTTTTTTTTSTSSSIGTAGVRTPHLKAAAGGVLQSSDVIAIVDSGTLPWDSYLSNTIYYKKHPYHVGSYWQVSDVYDLWFRSFFNDAKIIKPLKTSIVAIKYNLTQLGKLPENSLKLAYSEDNGKNWKILPTSVVDKKNKTVAALTTVKGYYMAVAGFGGDFVSYGTQPSEVVKDNKKVEKIQTQELKITSSPASPRQESQNQQTSVTPKKSLLQKIFDFVLRKN